MPIEEILTSGVLRGELAADAQVPRWNIGEAA
jgi:hypothetical protein